MKFDEGTKRKCGQCSLIEDRLGGWAFPVPANCQSPGKSVEGGSRESSVELLGLGTQGNTLGFEKLVVSRWVPSKGMGPLLAVAVIEGTDPTSVMDSEALFPLTLPPSDLIDCHDPLLSLYV